MSTEKILKILEEKKYKFVDLRFCDTLGKEQHVTLPISAVDEDLFEEGKCLMVHPFRAGKALTSPTWS